MQLDCLDLNGEGRRRSAGSGATEHARSNSIRHELPVERNDDQPKARTRREIRDDGTGRDRTQALAIRAARLA